MAGQKTIRSTYVQPAPPLPPLTHRVTGDGSPSANGDYRIGGTLNGEFWLRHQNETWYLWFDGVYAWYLGTVFNNETTGHVYIRVDLNPYGVYGASLNVSGSQLLALI